MKSIGRSVLAVVSLVMGLTRAGAAEVTDYLAFVGTYTGGKSEGIYVARYDARSGQLSGPELAARTPNPTFLALHPEKPLLFAVNEIGEFEGERTGAVSAFRVDRETGKLELLNQAPSGGGGPCHLNVDATGRFVLVANYGGGTVAVLPVSESGELKPPVAVVQHEGSSVNSNRQRSPHAHSINLDARNRFAVAADLGIDRLIVYRFDERTGSLERASAFKLKPGAGPRHFTFHPDGRRGYVINELHGTVTVLDWDDETGRFSEIQTISTLPPGESMASGFSTAEVLAHPSGRFLFGSNRGHDSIVAYRIDGRTGRLTYVENESTRGRTPRNFVIDPLGHHLLAENQESDSVMIFRIDSETGELEAAGEPVAMPVPVCIRFLPVGGSL